MKATTEQIVSALRVLSVEMHSEDGVANAVVAEAADRLTLMANLVARQVEETKDDMQQMARASDTLIKVEAKIQNLRARIKRLEEWKESALEVEREWDANAIATLLGAKLGESHRKVIQREVPKLLTRIKRLEEAGDAVEERLGCGCGCGGPCRACRSASENWFKVKEAKL